MKAHELLTDESKWTQHAFAKDSYDLGIDVQSDQAVKWCLTGALSKCYGEDDFRFWNILREVRNSIKPITAEEEKESLTLRSLTKRGIGVFVAEWNDSSERTFTDVHKLLLKLDL